MTAALFRVVHFDYAAGCRISYDKEIPAIIHPLYRTRCETLDSLLICGDPSV